MRHSHIIQPTVKEWRFRISYPISRIAMRSLYQRRCPTACEPRTCLMPWPMMCGDVMSTHMPRAQATTRRRGEQADEEGKRLVSDALQDYQQLRALIEARHW